MTLLILGMMPRCVRPLHREFHAHHAAGVWLQTQIELGDRVLTNSPYVSFYAQKRATWLADDDLSRPPSRPELVAPGRTFVVIDTSRTSSIDSQWLAPHGVHCVGQQTFSTVLRGERRDVFLSELQTMSKRRFARRS